ncbi:sodium/calcium exchanger 2-like, partial [Carlito syrichta]|uniref:Sodium/calcium exchanger 2-like n=1 Tax=Carlito syrichta TaxID=1868482 RepID=A0A3Q0DRK2_CARSF
EGTLVFKPGETQKELRIGIIDDDIFEEDEHFFGEAGSDGSVTEVKGKTLQVKIVDDEEYEKKDNFFIELGQPQWLKRGISALLLSQGDGDRKLTAEEEEARRIAEMGKPVLGENCRLEVIIEESYDFKNTVDKLIKKTNLALVIGTHSWREQFLEAITVSAGDEEEEEDGSREERLPSCFDYVMHFLTVFWKVLFACVPPTEYCHGWACFGVCILVIGLLTALIGDLASHFGCTVGLKDSVNAVVFVALGTSIP